MTSTTRTNGALAATFTRATDEQGRVVTEGWPSGLEVTDAPRP